jgi:hypothetical protein
VPASTAATYIFTAPTSTPTTIPPHPCALNAGIQGFGTGFQHFILRFNKISLLYGYALKEGFRGVKGGPKHRVKTGEFVDISDVYGARKMMALAVSMVDNVNGVLF